MFDNSYSRTFWKYSKFEEHNRLFTNTKMAEGHFEHSDFPSDAIKITP